MRALIFILLITLTPLPALGEEAVDKREPFYGIWGNKKQCAREPFKKGGTVRAAPYVITPQWLKQGTLWCSLNWGSVENTPTGKQSAANAHCGEDSVRSYFLGFKLQEEKLALRWDFLRTNGPLERCNQL